MCWRTVRHSDLFRRDPGDAWAIQGGYPAVGQQPPPTTERGSDPTGPSKSFDPAAVGGRQGGGPDRWPARIDVPKQLTAQPAFWASMPSPSSVMAARNTWRNRSGQSDQGVAVLSRSATRAASGSAVRAASDDGALGR